MKTPIVLILVSAALLAQNAARQIVTPSLAASERSWQARRDYTYMKRDQDRTNVDILRIVSVDGVAFEQLVEHNGKPLSAEEQKKQQVTLDRLKHETSSERTARLRKQEENITFMRGVPDGFDFVLLGEEVVNGRPAYILHATPHPDYHPAGKYGKVLSNVDAKLWVDRQDFGWVKADGWVMQPFSMGLIPARVLPGSHITMEQTRIGDGIWLPKRVEVRGSAKVFFVKTLEIDRILTYSDYQPAPSGTAPTASTTTQ